MLDTPGMRSLSLTDMSGGIETIFEDIEALADACRFSDCQHDTEPGCAVSQALDDGTLEPDRLKRWRKLKSEERRNSETLAESRARDKGFGKMVKGVMKHKRQERGN